MEAYHNSSVSFSIWIINATINTEDYDKAKHRRFFIQPLIGYSWRAFEVGFTPSFTGVDMTIIDQDVREFIVFYEPVLVGKVGGKYVKFILQAGLCIPIGVGNYNEEIIYETSFDFSPVLLSFGINVSFGGNKD